MLFEHYANDSRVCNVSVNSKASMPGYFAFRGDMVIEEGDIADTRGRRHPPKSLIKQAVALSKEDALTLVAGAVDDITYVKEFISKYHSDFAKDVRLFLYVSNISRPMRVTIEGVETTLVPHGEGAVWTMLMDDIRLEKSDFKGQSAEDKVVTMFNALNEFYPDYDLVDYNDALGYTIAVKKEARGPV